ncbi:hypothetical protein ACFL2H_04200, partial [Planctomycetota bacterium]
CDGRRIERYRIDSVSSDTFNPADVDAQICSLILSYAESSAQFWSDVFSSAEYDAQIWSLISSNSGVTSNIRRCEKSTIDESYNCFASLMG